MTDTKNEWYLGTIKNLNLNDVNHCLFVCLKNGFHYWIDLRLGKYRIGGKWLKGSFDGIEVWEPIKFEKHTTDPVEAQEWLNQTICWRAKKILEKVGYEKSNN